MWKYEKWDFIGIYKIWDIMLCWNGYIRHRKHGRVKKEKLCLNIWLKEGSEDLPCHCLYTVLQTEYSNHSLVCEIHFDMKDTAIADEKILSCFQEIQASKISKKLNFLIQTCFFESVLLIVVLTLSQLWIVFPLTDIEQTLCVWHNCSPLYSILSFLL